MKPFRIVGSLRFQLIVTYLIVILLTFLMFSFYLSKKIENELNTQSRDLLIQQGAFAANHFAHSLQGDRLIDNQRQFVFSEMKRLSRQTESWVGLVNQKAFV